MSNGNSTSVEVLTPGEVDFYEDDPNEKGGGKKKKANGVIGKKLADVTDTFQELRQKHSRSIDIAIYLLLNLICVGYFAYATYYFTEYGPNRMDFCNGYGMVVLLFCFIYIIVFYNILYVPYIEPKLEKALEPVQEWLESLFGKAVVRWLFYGLCLVAILIFLVVDSWSDPNRLIALGGFFVMILFGFVFSVHPTRVRARPVICGLIVQFILGLATIRWTVGRDIFKCAGDKVTVFLKYTDVGSQFVYGDDLVIKVPVFAFEAMSVIFFLCFMVQVLYYYGVVQKVVVGLGVLLQKFMGTTICESVNAAANIFLGMTESPILLQPYLQDLTMSEIHAVMAAGFAAVSGTVLAAYISFGASASHLITASVMSAPASLCFAKLFYPETEETTSTKEKIVIPESQDESVLDAACRGASMGVEIVLGIIANVIAFVTFIAFVDGVIGWLGLMVGQEHWSIEEFLSYIFMPLSFLMGVPWEECQLVARLIGIKTIINEFAAYKQLGDYKSAGLLSPRSEAIATYAVCGFSNPGSVGIMISTLSTLIPGKRAVITSLVFRSFVAGALVCFMTACIAGMLMSDEALGI